MSNRARGIAKKSELRTWVVDQVLDALSSDHIFKTLDYRRKTEAYLKQYMHQPLLAALVKHHRELSPTISATALQRKAKRSLFWEGDVSTTINNIQFLGVQHRPDFKVLLDSNQTRIAIEIKLGSSGSALREGIGQAIVYSASDQFDFTVFLFVDTSRDKKIVAAQDQHRDFIDSLWENYNVRFEVV